MNNEKLAENSNGSRSREEMLLLGFVRGFLVWFVVYMLLQGQDGFFAVTIDRVQSTWLQLLFLNIPVQLILTIIASYGLTKGQSPARTRFALAIAIVNAVLIVGHIGLSMMTA
jgi:succinate dehydrogenase hydrophobic anchor subunit